MGRKKLKYSCYICPESFSSWQKRNKHIEVGHPAKLPPKKTIEIAPMNDEEHKLLAGKNIQLGDVIWIGRKAVVSKIIRTEGSDDIEVILKISKKWWSKDEIE